MRVGNVRQMIREPSHIFRPSAIHISVVQSQTLVLIMLAGLITLNACGGRESKEQRQGDANSPAGKAGQAAHKMAVEAEKAAQVAKRKLDKAAHDAREGWKEDARKDRDKKQ